jgi:integrase
MLHTPVCKRVQYRPDMATFSQLPSGKWRVQVRRAGVYRAATFASKRDAKDWAAQIEAQASHIAASGYAPPPKGATLADLLDKYLEDTKPTGRTKLTTLAMLRRELGTVKLSALSAMVLRDFIDKRTKSGAGGVTIAADLSFLSGALKWGRHARHIDLPDHLARDARASLSYRGLDTRSTERDREPTDDELAKLYAYWRNNSRQRLPMEVLCRFALATGMRQAEITRLEIEDLDSKAKTIIIRDRKDPRFKKGNDQTVPLLPDAWAIVQEVLKERDSGFLFPYSEASVSASFTRSCKQVKIVDLRFHDLRHRATADFFRMGLDIPRVAIMTGHKTWGMLRRYTSIKPADVHAAVKKPRSPSRGSSKGNKAATGKPENDPAA